MVGPRGATDVHTHTWALWSCPAFPQLLDAPPYRPCHPPPSAATSLPAPVLFPASSNPCPLGARCSMPHACPLHDQESVSPVIPRHTAAKSSGMLRAGWPGVSRTSLHHPLAPGLSRAAGSAHGDLTLSWVETNFPGPGEKERDWAEQPGQPLGHPHGCTQGRGSRLGGRPGAAGSLGSAALLRALAVLRGVSAASCAPGNAPRPA